MKARPGSVTRRLPGKTRKLTDAKQLALSTPVQPIAPSIDEMLGLMTRQIMEVVHWTNAEGFLDSYRSASANTRGLFQTAAIKLAARADQLRKLC